MNNQASLAIGVIGAGGGGITEAPPPGRRCAEEFAAVAIKRMQPRRNAVRRRVIFMAV